MNNKDFVEHLKQRLFIEFKKQDRSGVYGYTQRSMAYNSNKIEGSTFTKEALQILMEKNIVTGTHTLDDVQETINKLGFNLRQVVSMPKVILLDFNNLLYEK